MENARSLPQVFSFADESEYKIPWPEGRGARHIRYVYAVGAVVVESEDLHSDVLRKLRELREEATHDPSIRNHDERQRLKQSGWHLTEDQLTTSAPLWQFMGHSIGIKYHYRYTESFQKIDGAKLSRVYAVLHATIVRDLVRRYKYNPSIEFTFEQFTDLNSKFAALVNFCSAPVEELDGKHPGVKVVAKGDSDLSAVADYMILGISRLIAQNEIECEKSKSCGGQCRAELFDAVAPTLAHLDSKNAHFRNFENIRTNLSSIYKIRLHTAVLS